MGTKGVCPTCGVWLKYDSRYGYVCPRRFDLFHQAQTKETVIPAVWIKAAMDRHKKQQGRQGVDSAQPGNDRTTVTLIRKRSK